MKISEAAQGLLEGRLCPPLPGWERVNLPIRTPGVKGVRYSRKEGRAVKEWIKLISQNPNKPGSKWAKMAQEGHQIVQVWYRLDELGIGWGVVVDGIWWRGGQEPLVRLCSP